MSTTDSFVVQYCSGHKTVCHRAAAGPGPEVRRECPMIKFTALLLLATNSGDTTGRRHRHRHVDLLLRCSAEAQILTKYTLTEKQKLCKTKN